ncbi:hypothetical protein J1N35_004981 [Gossypium stocksii]|uniref:Uncharacterized protein n=1 Tax=Gossypium stocksii TaxID=47602 RepID=A0A9D4AIU2_9ROSI|nr:hypothetical protein J1N35_004981 [Gossypium stocksii]
MVLDSKCPLANQAKARTPWRGYDEINRYYVLASMTNILFKQLKSCDSVKKGLNKLEDMFKEGRENMLGETRLSPLGQLKTHPCLSVSSTVRKGSSRPIAKSGRII